MQITEQEKQKYQKLVEQKSPNSKLLGNSVKAFIVGGLICVFGQFILNTLKNMGQHHDNAAIYTAIALVFLGALLTGLGLYEKLGKFAGAGTAVPITGFANAMTASAIEFKKEGQIMGVGAKMFILAGPVIVFGTFASMIIGTIYYYYSKGGM